MDAHTRIRGNDRLSDRNVGDSKSADNKGRKSSASARDGGKGRRAKRTGDVGRALRSVYDETLRENVPDDFLDLLGKLS